MFRAIGRFGLTLLLISATAHAKVPIEGRVNAEDSGAWRDADVRLYAVTSVYEEGRRRLLGEDEGEPVALSRVDDDGRFELLAPRPGLWRVVVSVPGQGAMEHRLLPLRDPVSLPPLSVGGPETPIWRRAGEPARPGPEGPVWTARILDRQGRGVAAALAVDERGPFAMSSEDGYLELSGCEDLCAFDIFTKEGHWKGFSLRTPAGKDPVELRLDPPPTVTGRVVSEPGGDPVPNAVVWSIAREQPPNRFRLGAPLVVTTSDAQGRFELVLPPASRLTVGAAAAQHEVAELSKVEASEDDRGDLVLVLKRQAEPKLTVALRDADGAAVKDSQVLVTYRGRRSELRAEACISQEDGLYFCHLDRVGKLGRATVLVSQDRRGSLKRGVDLRNGPARVELSFPLAESSLGGQALDAGGEPVEGARVELGRVVGTGRDILESFLTGSDGTFRVEGLAAGVYSVEVGKAGFATFRDEVEVGEAAAEEVTICLAAGITLRGRVLGLTPERTASVTVLAAAGERWLQSQVDREGRYAIQDLGPGPWTVRARLPDVATEVRREVVLSAGSETELDLEFAETWTLSGTVLANGLPLEGATISLNGRGHSAEGSTDELGRFRMERTPAGEYRVAVDAGGSVQRVFSLELATNRELEIDLVTSTVEGRVRTEDGQALPKIDLAIEPTTTDAGAYWGHSVGQGRATTDDSGFFRFDHVPEGTWRVRTLHPPDGFAPAEATVTTGAEQSAVGIDLVLKPTQGITFQVAMESGEIPFMVALFVVDDSGRRIVSGQRYPTADGTVRMSNVPEGSWDLWVFGPGSVYQRTAIQAPGDAGRIVLPAGGMLQIRVAGLEGKLDPGWLTLIGPDGQSYSPPSFLGGFEEWPVIGEASSVLGLAPGRWRYSLQHPDGRTWTGEFTVAAGERVEISIP